MKSSLYYVVPALLIGLFVGYAVGKQINKGATISQVGISPHPQMITIGTLLPLTGKFAGLGEDTRNGLEIAREDVRARYGATVAIQYEDSASDPKIAVPAASKLIDIDKVGVVIGGPGSSANLAVAPLMEKSQTIFIVISATPKLNDAGEYIFKVHPDIDGEAKRMAAFMYRKGHRRVGILYDAASETQVQGKDVFTITFQEQGGKIAIVEGYDSKTVTDFRTSFTKMKGENVDALYLLAIEKVAGLAVKQAREIGFTQPIFGWSPFDSAEFLQSAGEYAEGVIITAQPFSCTGTDAMQKYCQKYQEKFGGRKPLHYGALAYDVLDIIAKTMIDNNVSAFAREPRDKEAIINTLLATKRYEGASGVLAFDDAGNVRDQEFVFRIVKNGVFEEYRE